MCRRPINGINELANHVGFITQRPVKMRVLVLKQREYRNELPPLWYHYLPHICRWRDNNKNISNSALSNYLSYKKHIANKSGLKINTIQSKASSNDLYTNTVSPFKAIRRYLSLLYPLMAYYQAEILVQYENRNVFDADGRWHSYFACATVVSRAYGVFVTKRLNSWKDFIQK